MSRHNTVGRVATTVAGDGNGFIDVTYHFTKVVHFNEEIIRLNNGGWQSNTTKVRMNQAARQFNLGYGVYQKKHQWYVDFQGQTFLYSHEMRLDRKTGKAYHRDGQELQPIEQ